jgi:hypothetical protein
MTKKRKPKVTNIFINVSLDSRTDYQKAEDMVKRMFPFLR